ncbi:MAG: hypothetical protein NWE99_06940 [Candidatus Bathyarchaeota archaeon]|nr:hypothetical protein [Candidatus Bathyarchaeota archaeon]
MSKRASNLLPPFLFAVLSSTSKFSCKMIKIKLLLLQIVGMERLARTASLRSPANQVVYKPIAKEIQIKAKKTVSKLAKEMISKGSYNENRLIEKAFERVSGRSVEELKRFSVEELDLDSKLNDGWQAVHEALDDLKGGTIYGPEIPLLSEHFRHGEQVGKGYLTRIADWTKRHPKATAAVLGGIVLGAAATYLAANYFLNLPPSFDTDRDGLLNGSNVTLPKGDSQSTRYINEGIIHRVNSDGTLTFFGEKTLGSDPHVKSPDAVNQALFLSSISQQEYDKIKADGNLANFNIDGDSWSNRFEQLTGSPYNVKNDIYAILLTHAGQGYPPVKEMFDILKNAKIPKDHIYDLGVDDNNSANFKAACDKIAQVSDKNDTVLFVINGEGAPGEFGFHKGVVENGKWHSIESARYTWFRDVTDNIVSKNKIFIFDTCYSGSAIKYLEGENTIILTSATDKQQSDFGICHKFLKAFSNPSADTDKNGYVSIGEAAEYAKNIGYSEIETPQISDISNIGKTSYLIEQIVG